MTDEIAMGPRLDAGLMQRVVVAPGNLRKHIASLTDTGPRQRYTKLAVFATNSERCRIVDYVGAESLGGARTLKAP